jgi:hypothetical protein
MRTFLAVRPDTAKLLAAVTLCETSLGFVCLYTLTAIWQRLVSLNISSDFDVLTKVIRKGGIFFVVGPSAGNRQVVDNCLKLITAKPRFTNPSEMFSAGAETGRCHITACTGFWDLG